MSYVRGLIDRLLLICAAVAGGLVPGFISQYRQRLGGRLDQARLDLAPWQKLGLSAEGILFAMAFAACIWLLFQASWSLTAAGISPRA